MLVDGRRFAHVERLLEDPTITDLFGMKSVVADNTIKRLFAAIPAAAGTAWVAQAAGPIRTARPKVRLVRDWDSTVQTKCGHQEGAARGYNPTKPGRKSFHPLLAISAGTRLCVAYRFRSGDTVTATQWQAAMEDARVWLGDRQPWPNRGDLGLGHEAIMAWHETASARPKYLFELKLTANVRRAMHALSRPPSKVRAPPGFGKSAKRACACTAGRRCAAWSSPASSRTRHPRGRPSPVLAAGQTRACRRRHQP